MSPEHEEFWQSVGGLLAAYILGIITAFFVSCSPHAAPEYDTVTPGGLRVDSNGNSFDPVKLDTAWASESKCFGYNGSRRPLTRIVSPVGYDPSGIGLVTPTAYGLAGTDVVVLCPDVAAEAHEYAHIINYYQTGNMGENYSGKCSL